MVGSVTVAGGYSSAAMFFHSSTRSFRAALSLRRPRARIVTTIVVGFCAFHNFVLLSDSRKSENIFAQRVADDPLPSRENRPSPNGWSGQVEEIGGRILGVMFKACVS